MTTLVKLSESLLTDVASLFGIPVNTATSVFREYVQRRADEALAILLDELRAGEIDSKKIAGEDEAIAVIYRYLLAVRDGSARRNLRLLAKVIAGLAASGRLSSEDFNTYAEMLARLSRDEILVIGRLHHYRKAEEKRQGSTVGSGQYWQKFVDELVPEKFPTEEHIIAVCCSGMRSGLIITPKDFDSTGYYATSPIMDEIDGLVDFRDVLTTERETPRESS